jgi:hypothetical protein
VNALTGERLSRMIAQSREKCSALDQAKIAEIDKTLDITFQEHFQFQQTQAQFHAGGVLTPEAAQIVYAALGESLSSSNGGWSKGVDTATKFVVTQLMSELLRLSIAQRGVKVS